MREESERFQIIANLSAGPVLGADKFAADHALTVNDVRFRPHLGVIEGGGFLRGVADGDQVDVVTAEEVSVSAGVLVDADGQHGYTGQVVVQVKQGRHLLHAGAAPGSPEIEQHHATAIVGQVYGCFAVRDGEVRRCFANLSGTRAAIAAHRGRQRSQQKKRE